MALTRIAALFKNQPMSASHSPPIMPEPKKGTVTPYIMTKPQAMKIHANACLPPNAGRGRDRRQYIGPAQELYRKGRRSGLFDMKSLTINSFVRP
jgi:hypothetical protein